MGAVMFSLSFVWRGGVWCGVCEVSVGVVRGVGMVGAWVGSCELGCCVLAHVRAR